MLGGSKEFTTENGKLKMSRARIQLSLVLVLTVMVCLMITPGCSDPESIGRFQATPVTNIILDNLGVVDEEPELFVNAREPRQEDLLVPETEYVIRSGDMLLISIYDLFRSGEEFITQKQVSESGRITLPFIGSVRASDLTELEFQASLEDALSPDYIKDPKVSVVVQASTGKVYTVTGAVPAPAPYQLTEPDLRVLKALANAGDAPQRGVDFVYIIRKVPTSDLIDSGSGMSENGFSVPDISSPADTNVFSPVDVPETDNEADFDAATEKPVETGDDGNAQKQLLESISPMTVVSMPDWVENGDSVTMADAADDSGFEIVRGEGGFQIEGEAEDTSDIDDLGWDISGDTGPFGYKPSQYKHEVIKINMKELKSGDFDQNVVILPGDYIYVPFNTSGVYYVMGQVARPGPYQLTGENMTLKQAIAGVGGLSALASMDRCDITRRIKGDKEITYRVNLKKLFEGVQPDIYIKPNDLINIGSHPTARWLAVIRQSFRSTYGFGFVYDRNLADKDFGR